MLCRENFPRFFRSDGSLLFFNFSLTRYANKLFLKKQDQTNFSDLSKIFQENGFDIFMISVLCATLIISKPASSQRDRITFMVANWPPGSGHQGKTADQSRAHFRQIR